MLLLPAVSLLKKYFASVLYSWCHIWDYISASISSYRAVPSTQTSSGHGLSADDEELEFALALSRQMAEEEKRKRRQEEEDLRDEELQRVLKLSLEDK